jgi:flavin-binding protein dodecin
MKTVYTDEIYRVIDDLETRAESSEARAAEALQYAASELRKVLK